MDGSDSSHYGVVDAIEPNNITPSAYAGMRDAKNL